uniref:RING-type domain-containing protein n=1 Tax=Astatotilapia calliptera TaxID=8154 RepID=A0A3P8RG74_ASTCA
WTGEGTTNKLCCSICLDLLKDPVTIPCGHSYCMNCVKIYWDEEDQKETHSCPQCRQTFTPVRNTVIADLDLKKTSVSASSELEDVSCDFCTDTKLKAVKSLFTSNHTGSKHCTPTADII